MATFVTGAVWNLSYDSKIALRLRNLPSEEHSAALGLKLKHLLLSADFQYLTPKEGGQCKLLLDTSPIPLNGWWSIGMRIKERLRSYGSSASLTDIRVDNYFSYASSLRTNLRLEASYDLGTLASSKQDGSVAANLVKPGILGYIEQGYVGDRLAIWGRLCAWDIPSWEERIYVYERDAPQCFNMRAYYKSGVSCSLYASFKSDRMGRFYLRISARDSRVQYALSF